MKASIRFNPGKRNYLPPHPEMYRTYNFQKLVQRLSTIPEGYWPDYVNGEKIWRHDNDDDQKFEVASTKGPR